MEIHLLSACMLRMTRKKTHPPTHPWSWSWTFMEKKLGKNSEMLPELFVSETFDTKTTTSEMTA